MDSRLCGNDSFVFVGMTVVRGGEGVALNRDWKLNEGRWFVVNEFEIFVGEVEEGFFGDFDLGEGVWGAGELFLDAF